MSLKKQPVTGMKDILPDEMTLRDYLIGVIKETYRSFGFTPMETPCVEHIENLTSKQGGDNEKLIFKILKRGEKLRLADAAGEEDLCDSGLRYDLTLPLTRYYANNAAKLPSPFKALQCGSVWRADRPQKGRYRQFTQCDIDILGEESNLAEIELILAIAKTLKKLVPENDFLVRVNDRKILRAMVAFAGFPAGQEDGVLITLDKMDKIGTDGVRAELIENGASEASADQYLGLLKDLGTDAAAVRSLGEKLGDFLEPGTAEGLAEIMEAVQSVTGTIFEVSMEGFGGSVAGGGRYDKMVGKFTGTDVPACGFSIGFERIIAILMDQQYVIPTQKEKVAILLDKKLSAARRTEALQEAEALRAEEKDVLVTKMAKNKKFQREQLSQQGYTVFRDYFEA